jgi:putative tricarboxylic transport membrane protein
MAPLLFGFILGGMMEDNLRRALLINDDSLSFLWERPITLTIMLITVLILIAPVFQKAIKRIFHIESRTDNGLTID